MPDIGPQRLSAIDVASLDGHEVRSILLLLAGHADPVVCEAVINCTRRVLERTRLDGWPAGGQEQLSAPALPGPRPVT